MAPPTEPAVSARAVTLTAVTAEVEAGPRRDACPSGAGSLDQLGRDENGRWELQPLKTRSSVRSVALPAVVVESLDDHLRQWMGHGREGFVFTAPDGGHIDPDNFRSKVWKPTVAAAGLAPLRIHDPRHTTASLAIAAGADVKMLQTMLRHASATMTLDRYGHLMPGRAQRNRP